MGGVIRGLRYWLRRLFGHVPCAICGHPGYHHVGGDMQYEAFPACVRCAALMAGRKYAWTQAKATGVPPTHEELWRSVYAQPVHDYEAVPFRLVAR